MNYNSLLLEHFNHPQNVGVLTGPGPYYKTRQGQDSIGDVFDLAIAVDDKGLINEIKYKAKGSPYLIAGLSYASQCLTQKPFRQMLEYDFNKLISVFDIPKIKYYTVYMIEDGFHSLFNEVSNERGS